MITANLLRWQDCERLQAILIHDGARPLIAPELIDQTVAALHEVDAAAVGIAVKDTLKTLNTNQVITGTVDRTGLAQIQTPQGFRTTALRAAHENALLHGLIVTDDCALVENTGLQIRVVPGSALNIKITTPEDLVLGEAILQYIKENES